MRPTLLLALLCACDDKTTSVDDTGETVYDTAAGENFCTALFDRVTELYSDAGTLGECTGNGATIAESLMNLDGVEVDNDGESMDPCVEVRCDSDYAYIAANDVGFYDFVGTTPNALVESKWIYRIPLNPQNFGDETADNVETNDACVDAYNEYVNDPAGYTDREPSERCVYEDGDVEYLYDPATGTTTRKILCLNQVGTTIAGSPTFGPNEAHTPFAYGNPAYWYPTGEANDSYYSGMTTALDLCGFHTSDVGHNHAENPVCYELDEDNAPANSYVDVAEAWDLQAAIDGDCTEESGIVGWSFDGYPIKGPCVCVERNDDGSCASVMRARSSWHYAGLSQWAENADSDPDSDGLLNLEGRSCASDDDCCPDGEEDCEYVCHYETFEDSSEASGSKVAKACVLHDYSWCAHDYVDHSDVSPQDAGVVPLDMCNGYEGPDGYAYHATMTFPFLQACYRGVPSSSIGATQLDIQVGGGGGGEPGGEGGGEPGGGGEGGGPPPSAGEAP